MTETEVFEKILLYRKTKNNKTFTEILNQFLPAMKYAIKTYSYFIAGDDYQDAKSIGYETLLKCVNDYEKSNVTFNTYFITKFRFALIDNYRKHSKIKTSDKEITESYDNLYTDYDEKTRKAEITKIVDSLKPCYRLVYYGVINGLKQKEIAQCFRVSPGRVSKIKKQLIYKIGVSLENQKDN